LCTQTKVVYGTSLFAQGGPNSWLGPGRAMASKVQPGLARGPTGPCPSLHA